MHKTICQIFDDPRPLWGNSPALRCTLGHFRTFLWWVLLVELILLILATAACAAGANRVDTAILSGTTTLTTGSNSTALSSGSGGVLQVNGLTVATGTAVAYSATSGTAGFAFTSGTAGYAPTSGTAGFAVTSGSAAVSGSAGYALTSGSAAASSMAGYAATSGTAASAANALMSSELAANAQRKDIIWVDAATGNDATGTRGIFTRPFLTGTGAMAVYQPGDTIWLYPGPQQGIDITGTALNYATIRGCGSGAYSADDSTIVGGTRIVSGVMGAQLPSTSGTLVGVKWEHFSIDQGIVVTGSSAASASFLIAPQLGYFPASYIWNGCEINDIKTLGSSGTASVGYESIALYNGHHFVCHDLVTRRCQANGIVVKSSDGTMYNLEGAHNGNTLVIKQAGTGSYDASTVDVEGIALDGNNDQSIGLLIQDGSPNNPSLSNIIVHGLRSRHACATACEILSSGTYPLGNICFSDCTSDGDGTGLSVSLPSGGDVRGVVSGFMVRNSYGTAYNLCGNLTLVGCGADGCYVGFQTQPPALPYNYCKFLGCWTNNITYYGCNILGGGAYLSPQPISMTGSGSVNGTLVVPPFLFRAASFPSAYNTTSETSVIDMSGVGYPARGSRLIPKPLMAGAEVKAVSEGLILSTGTGGDVITFKMKFNGVVASATTLPVPSGATPFRLMADYQQRSGGTLADTPLLVTCGTSSPTLVTTTWSHTPTTDETVDITAQCSGTNSQIFVGRSAVECPVDATLPY